MKRGLVVTAVGATVLIAGLSGCSDKKESSGGSSATATASATAPGGGGSTAGTGTAKVTVDGKAQDVSGSIGCTTAGGNVVIAIGNGTGGLGATLTDADPPEVKAVGLGSVGGQALAYAPGVPGNDAKATKDGKTYKISGTITAVDMSNPTAPSNKPFEMEVTCP
ncbi:lipoprotein LpqH [Mycobacterium sp. MAA66]|jgi:lipoprotein LpqH|uniref:lipoprotein LpqH n=1 Tax=Mycobacterium sp. MAA66 TaxID=3156297 RepID=UPI003514BD4D